jgi:hypothetical protein
VFLKKTIATLIHEQVKEALDKNTTAICNEKHQSHVMTQTERTSQEIEDNPLSSGGYLSNGVTLLFFYLFSISGFMGSVVKFLEGVKKI